MRKLTIGIVLMIALMLPLTSAIAEDVANVTPVTGLSVTFPMETGAVGFWFPDSGAFAGGLSHTFLRIQHSALPKVSLDTDLTIAQQVNIDKDTLGGIGEKINLNVINENKAGFTFLPSIGITVLNNFEKYKALQDIIMNKQIAVYGTLLQYKW